MNEISLTNLNPNTLKAIGIMAESNNRSLTEEIKFILENFIQDRITSETTEEKDLGYYVNKAIEEIKELKGDNLTSGEDSCLENVWEEYIFQIFEGESSYYNSYTQTIAHICQNLIKSLTDKQLSKLWMECDTVRQRFYEHNDECWDEETEELNEDIQPYGQERIDLIGEEMSQKMYNIAEGSHDEYEELLQRREQA